MDVFVIGITGRQILEVNAGTTPIEDAVLDNVRQPRASSPPATSN